jgi:hypothetical protein
LDLQRVGKVAELKQDGSPLQLGMRGAYDAQRQKDATGILPTGPFTLIGRVQMAYAEGLWNEWCVLFDTGKIAWLSEAVGTYVLSQTRTLKTRLPRFEDIEPLQNLVLNGSSLMVEWKGDEAHVHTLQGELPTAPVLNEAWRTVDLRGTMAGLDIFATLDFTVADQPPVLYLGRVLTLDQLELVSADTVTAAVVASSEAFACPNCGASLQPTQTDTQAITCGHCHALVTTADRRVQMVQDYQRALKLKPLIPLGNQGRLRGTTYTLIGFFQRSTKSEGTTWSWREYLLHSPAKGYAWLTEYRGHWNFAQTAALKLQSGRIGESNLKARMRDQDYYLRRFADYEAEVTFVLGECYWRVQVGEKQRVIEYIAPPSPLMLACERSVQGYEKRKNGDGTLSLCEYIQPEEIAKAFGLKERLPLPIGVYPNQPPPPGYQQGKYWVKGVGWCVLIVILHNLLGIWIDHKNWTPLLWAMGLVMGSTWLTEASIAEFENKRWAEGDGEAPFLTNLFNRNKQDDDDDDGPSLSPLNIMSGSDD